MDLVYSHSGSIESVQANAIGSAMIGAEAQQAFQTLYEVDKSKIDRQLNEEFSKRTALLASKGLLVSGAAANSMFTAAIETIPIRGQASLNVMFRAVASHGIKVDAETGAQVFSILAAYLDNDGAQLLAGIQNTAPFRSSTVASSSVHLRADLLQQIELEKKRIGGEIALVVASSTRAAKSDEPMQNLTFNGPVGLVQSGPGAFGVSNQRLDSAGNAELLKALEKISALLEDDHPSDEVRELISDAKDELAKPKPNISKIRGIIQGIGGTIAFLPRLKEGYETLRWAGTFIGVTLP